ncbi:MAG TPA: hypothetical protein VFQ63_04405, partial [Patescibacteria group bacterium]|nr:hypothetical protein [Patescibacteria group bacterium]
MAIAKARSVKKSTVSQAAAVTKKLKFSNPLPLLKKIPMPKTFTPVLVILLIIASFLLGMLLTKVQYLEQNGGSLYQAGAGTQPAAA